MTVVIETYPLPNHYHWQNNPFLSHSLPLKFRSNLYSIRPSGFHLLDFATVNFTEQSCQSCVQLKPGRLDVCIYAPQWHALPGIPFSSPLKIARLRWRYYNPPTHEALEFISVRKYESCVSPTSVSSLQKESKEKSLHLLFSSSLSHIH
jgi:hypothetical protein